MVCPALLQHRADASIRNTDGKTALDLAEPLTAQVLSGEYKKSELLQAARFVVAVEDNHTVHNV